VVYSGQWDDGDRVMSAAYKRNRRDESFSSFKDELAIWREMQDGQLFITQFLGLVVKDSIEYVSREFRFDLFKKMCDVNNESEWRERRRG
jgi:hypothetical protein